MECMRQYISELLDFIADMHTLTKLKVGTVTHINDYLFFNMYIALVMVSDFIFCSPEPYEGLLSATA